LAGAHRRWEGVSCDGTRPDWSCGYGAFGADGIFEPRSDLGGASGEILMSL
jgi:hypothetical protein